MFTTNLVHVNQPGPFHAALVHNGNVVVKLHGEYNTWDQTSQTVYLSLAPGDEVYVRNIDYEHETIYGDSYSSFSGMLVWELKTQADDIHWYSLTKFFRWSTFILWEILQ